MGRTRDNKLKIRLLQRDKTKLLFLASYKETLNVHKSVAAAGITRRQYYRWIQEDLEFAAQVDDCNKGILDQAAQNIYNGVNGGDTELSKYLLEVRGDWAKKENVDVSGNLKLEIVRRTI
jgi:hypothetical protein